MTAAYTPQPGTLAARAMAHFALLAVDAEPSNNVLADALGTDPNTLTACLAAPMRHGLLERFKREGRIYWRRGHATAAPPPAAELDDEEEGGDNTCGGRMPGEPITRIVPASQVEPLIGLAAQAWCPPAADTASSLDDPAAPPPSPAPPPFGLGWRAPRMPVFLADAPTPAVQRAATEPGPAAAPFLTRASFNEETVQALGAALAPAPSSPALTQDEQDLAADAFGDPDFREVERAPRPAEPDNPPKGAEAAQAPMFPGGGDDATPNDGVVPQETEFCCALWSTGVLEIVTSDGAQLKLKPDDARHLLRYVSEVLSARARAAA